MDQPPPVCLLKDILPLGFVFQNFGFQQSNYTPTTSIRRLQGVQPPFGTIVGVRQVSLPYLSHNLQLQLDGFVEPAATATEDRFLIGSRCIARVHSCRDLGGQRKGLYQGWMARS